MDRELEVAAEDGTDRHSLSPGALELAELITVWPQLHQPIRRAILTLVRSCPSASAEEFQRVAVPNCEIYK